MMSTIRILDTGLMPARWNIAMTAALADAHATRRAPDTIRFHRYPACVLLGRSQDAASAADLGYCRGHGIGIARRVTGGGAVFMSPHMLAWDVVVDRELFGGSLAALTRGISEGIAAGLSRLGCTARFRPPNDIEIGGRRVSGSSGYTEGRSALLQGTVLVEDDADVMAAALRIPEAALRAGVTSLAEAVGTPPPLVDIMECITQGLTDATRREPVPGQPGADELALCDALLRDEIGVEEPTRAAAPAEMAR